MWSSTSKTTGSCRHNMDSLSFYCAVRGSLLSVSTTLKCADMSYIFWATHQIVMWPRHEKGCMIFRYSCLVDCYFANILSYLSCIGIIV